MTLSTETSAFFSSRPLKLTRRLSPNLPTIVFSLSFSPDATMQRCNHSQSTMPCIAQENLQSLIDRIGSFDFPFLPSIHPHPLLSPLRLHTTTTNTYSTPLLCCHYPRSPHHFPFSLLPSPFSLSGPDARSLDQDIDIKAIATRLVSGEMDQSILSCLREEQDHYQ